MRTAKTKAKPKPGSPESVRRQTAELKTATALLKEARPVIERLEGELGIDKPKAPIGDRFALEDNIRDIRTWASIAWLVWAETRWHGEKTDDDELARIGSIT